MAPHMVAVMSSTLWLVFAGPRNSADQTVTAGYGHRTALEVSV